MQEDMLNVQEAMEYLGIKRAKLYKHVAQGDLKVYKSKANQKTSYFSKAELDNLKGFEPASGPAGLHLAAVV